jgi:hypothetical protein
MLHVHIHTWGQASGPPKGVMHTAVDQLITSNGFGTSNTMVLAVLCKIPIFLRFYRTFYNK